MRLFFALWPPRAVAESLHAWAVRAQDASGGRATRVGSIHVTLAFLGECSAEACARAAEAARRVRVPAHALVFDDAAWWKHNRIIWAGPAASDPALADALRSELDSAGFPRDAKPFRAHATLVRKASGGMLPAFARIVWPVRSFVLVRSQLSATGAAYEVLEEYPLP